MKDSILKFLKKIQYLFGSFLTTIGGIGAVGMALAAHEWVIAAGTLCVCGAAVPTIIKWIKKLIA